MDRPEATEQRPIAPQECPTCGTAAGAGDRTPPSYVYAIGRIEPRFRNLSVHNEFRQATGKIDSVGLTGPKTMQKVLSQPENRYLVRQLCWVMTVGGVESYILVPHDQRDFDRLVESLRPEPGPADLDVVIGVRGPIAPPQMCNALMAHVVVFDQIYSFDRASLIGAIPRPPNAGADFSAAAEELFGRMIQVTDNLGATDETRALNYLAVRYDAIYANAAEALARNAWFSGVEVRLSPLSGSRKIADVILCYTNKTTDVTEKFFVRVDVTEEFPFLVKKLSPYFDFSLQ